MIPGLISEATGGVTEPLRRRVVIPVSSSMAETDHVLGHELVHAFQYDISAKTSRTGGLGFSNIDRLPLWFIEGMGTGPIMGQRYRLEVGGAGGTLNFGNVLVDYRKYFRIAKPLILAGRFLHYGRYGGGADDQRLSDLYLGFPSLVRGYEAGSFSSAECGPRAATTGTCPIFDRLIGSKIAVVNAELRTPLLGYLGIIPSRNFPPLTNAVFYDAGVAWTGNQKAYFLGGPREPVRSYGDSLRFNLFGYTVLQFSAVKPVDRPLKGWTFEFSILPGF